MTNNINKRYVPAKNYFFVITMLVFLTLFTIYIFNWYNIKEKENLLDSYLITTGTISQHFTTFEELDSLLSEVPEKMFVFTGYELDENIKDLEKELKPIIDNYNLNDNFYYFNISEVMKKDSFYKDFEEAINKEVTAVPVILYYENGYLENTIFSSETEMFDIESFENLLDIYGYEKSN